MPTTTGTNTLTYPAEGATGWFSTWETFAQAITDHLDDMATTEINQINDSNGNEMLVLTTTASAVNHIDITNAVTTAGPTISSVGSDANVDLNLTPKAAGDLVLDGLKWPQADGSANEVLSTDGAGQLSWTSNGLANLVEDTTPQLGGGLDVNGQEITGAIDLHSSGDIICELGDALGSNKVIIKDSGAVEVASINSDGDIAATDISSATVTTTGLTDANTLSIAGGTAMTAILDEDTLSSDSATALATQQSIKAYVDNAGIEDWTLITTITTTSGSAYQVTSGLGTAYNDYLIILDTVSASTNFDLDLGVSDDGGSTYAVAFKGVMAGHLNGSDTIGYQDGADYDFCNSNVTSGADIHGYVHIMGNKNAAPKACSIVAYENSITDNFNMFMGVIDTASDIDALEFSVGSDVFDSGTIKIYGR